MSSRHSLVLLAVLLAPDTARHCLVSPFSLPRHLTPNNSNGVRIDTSREATPDYFGAIRSSQRCCDNALRPGGTSPLWSSTEDAEGKVGPEASGECTTAEGGEELTDEDWAVVTHVLSASGGDPKALEDVVTAELSRMHPRLLLHLRSAADGEAEILEGMDEGKLVLLAKVGTALKSVLDERLQGARDLLASLLQSGEIRKLDGAIGRAAKDGKLDMAFFTVLNMNIRDAAYEASGSISEEEQRAANEADPRLLGGREEGETGAGRLQILQHVYTRCQEEVEKAVSPGAGLLNKLLRTEIPSIRTNQLGHYLAPQKGTLTTPDGKEVELKGGGKALVPPNELVEAIADAIKKIRTVERAGGTDRVTAANLVESCRQVAIEARLVVADAYGETSDELKQFQDSLQPVFRPASGESQYMKGD